MTSVVSASRRRSASHTTFPAGSAEAILEALPDTLYRIDRSGRYLEYRGAKGLQPPLPPEEILGRTMHQVLPEDFADQGLEIIQQALDSGETQTQEYRILEEDRMAVYEARVVPLAKHEVLVIVRQMSSGAVTGEQLELAKKYALTKREMAVLQAVASGLTDKAVAQRLDISPLTVRKHVASIRKKMGAQSRTEASVRALKEGLVS